MVVPVSLVKQVHQENLGVKAHLDLAEQQVKKAQKVELVQWDRQVLVVLLVLVVKLEKKALMVKSVQLVLLVLVVNKVLQVNLVLPEKPDH
jgi:hypothetical protein